MWACVTTSMGVWALWESKSPGGDGLGLRAQQSQQGHPASVQQVSLQVQSTPGGPAGVAWAGYGLPGACPPVLELGSSSVI